MEIESKSQCSEVTHLNQDSSRPIMTLIPWKWDHVAKMKEVFKPGVQWSSTEVKKCQHSNSYNVLLDVRHFEGSDLTITLTGRTASIHGDHEEKGGTFERREFSRKFIFPSDAAMSHTKCVLNSNGVLHLRVPTKSAVHSDIGPSIPITKPEVRRTVSAPNPDTVQPNTSLPKSPLGEKFFSVALDVRFYDPSEIEVTTSGAQLKVEASHKEKDQNLHTYTSRQFSRTYSMPNEVDAEQLRAYLIGGGVLRIMGPKSVQGGRRGSGSKRQLRVPVQSMGGGTRRRSWVTDALLLQFGRTH